MIIDIVFHKSDYDGKFSGAVCKYWLEKAGHNVQTIGWDFGDPDPELRQSAELVYLVDLSVPSVLADPRVVWIDHHKSAIESNDFDIPGYRIDGVAACRLCWQWFEWNEDRTKKLPSKQDFIDRKVDEPFALTLAGEYDIFDLHDIKAIPFQYGLYSAEWDLDRLIETFLEPNYNTANVMVDQWLQGGQSAMQWHKQMAKELLQEQGYIVEFEGLKFHTLASCHARSTMWFPTEAIDPSADALMCWRYKGTEIIDFSLYHKPDNTGIDLSEIAVKYGGGGHKGACGFRLTVPQAIEAGVIKL